MTQALFTVPTTGKYTDSVDGGKYRYTAGQIIPLDWAVRLQMPGAALPAAGPPFNDAQVAYLTAQEADDAATDHTHATIATANLIPNGDFEAGITGWAASSGATIAHNVDDWAWSGTGCLEITTAGSGTLEGASVVFGGAFGYLAVVAGELYCAEAVVATEDDHVMALRVGFDQGSTRIIGYARESTISRECISGIFVVPPGATFLDSFALLTTATAAGQVYVDEVRLIRLGTVA